MGKPTGLGVPTVMERGAKVAIYGREGTGKTELVMSSRDVGKLLLLDTEGRSQYYDPKHGFGFEVMYSEKAEDAIDLLAYAEELHAKGEKVVFGVDSFSSLWFARQEIAEKAGSTSRGTAKFSSWALAKKPLKALYARLFETPVDCIITMRAKPRYEQDAKTRAVKDYGYNIPETERGMPYTVDLVLEMNHNDANPGTPLTPDDYWAVVTKSSGEKDNALPIGSKIVNPTFAKLLALRLEGAPGGMTFSEYDENILLQVGRGCTTTAELRDWVKSLGLDAAAVKDQMTAEFGDLESEKIPTYVDWVWEYFKAQKTPF